MSDKNLWWVEFWQGHGERIIYSGVAVTFALFFMYAGNEQLKATGEAILIGVAMLAFNKARGGIAEKGNKK